MARANTKSTEESEKVMEESVETKVEATEDAAETDIGALEKELEGELEGLDSGVYAVSTEADEGSMELVIPDVVEEEAEEEVPETTPKTGRNSRVSTVTSARKRRKLYNNGILFDDEKGKIQLNAKNSERYKEFLELAASAKSANIKKGVIVGVENVNKKENGDEDNDMPLICVVINYGKHWEVKIPVEQLVDFSLQPPENRKMIEAGGRAKEQCLRKIASAMEGAEVSYRVYAMFEDAGIAYADHLEAMSRKGRFHYTVIRRDGKPDIVSNMKVNAKVMAVNMIGMWVEAAGAQAFIRADEISWNRSSDITKLYSPGDTVQVLVTNIRPKEIKYSIREREKTVRVVEVDASVKRCMPNPNKEYFDKFVEGSRGTAEVVQITPDGIFVVYREKVTVLLSFPETGDNPDIGDKVSILIDRRIHVENTEDYLFYGKLLRINKKS